MENEVFTPLLKKFTRSPLVTWVRTFGPLAEENGTSLEEYMTLVDGVFLNEVMLQINPKSTNRNVNKRVNNDESLRIQNLCILVKKIKYFYQECLQQLIMMALPNVLIIGRNPLSEPGTNEINKILLLLLGCAVQCQKKEEFIERIQHLDFDTRAAVAAHIQEVTQNQENVFDLQWMDVIVFTQDSVEPLLKNMTLHLRRLVDERDEHLETIIELSEDRDSLHLLPQASAAQSPCGSPGLKHTESKQHLSVELADAKAKIRRLRQEIEEKNEQFLDYKQELERVETELRRLQQENKNLFSDARSARVYRDELDILREKAIRVDKLESEVSRYKERLHDMEFYKARVEELMEDNQVMLETKRMFEDQVKALQCRSDKLHVVEKENLQLKAKLHEMEMERDMDRKKIEELMEENMALEMAQKQSMDESLHLGWELEQINRFTDHSEVSHKSLGLEVTELTSSRLLKLEKENQSLLKTVEELRSTMDDSVGGNSSRILKMEKENQRLNKKIEGLEEEIVQEKQSLQNNQNLTKDLMKEKEQLEKKVETVRENLERQIKLLEQENERSNQTIASLRQRSQISAEAQMKEIEKENKILHESIKETSSKLNKLEFEIKQVKKEMELYKEKAERAEELENELHRLEKENELLQKKIANLNITCEKIEALEKENSDLDIENRKLKKTLDSLKNLSFQLESLEKENSQLDEENLELRRRIESSKCTSIKMAQLQLENKELESEKEQLKKSLELMKASFKKSERLEVSYQGLDTENQRLQKALENSNKKIQQLESELEDLESENQTLQKNLEELVISSKHLEQLEKENKLLEQETSQLEKDKKQLEKENKRLRQQAEIKDSTLEENNVKINHLEKENKSLFKQIAVYKESCVRLKELEMENKELVKRASIDKKTLVTLREDLVNEKLKTQQMNNDLEKLSHELEKIGLNKERLLCDEQSSDDRYKLLESKLESTLKKSLEIKEEKIAALEARLEESTNLNQQLRQELKTVKKNYEALKQRQEEERMVQNPPPRKGEENQSVNKWEKENQETTRELLKVKDRLIEVERNNATLQAEKQALKTQLKQLETQNNNLQAQILALQRQTVSLQEQNTTLQTQNAKLQVENSTLNSQSTSLMNQNAQLLIQQSALENEKEGVLKELEDLKSLYDSLLKDHEKLEHLHERQASEYESLIAKHGSLKSAHKNLEVEHKDLEDRYNQLLKQKVQLEELEKVLKTEQEKMLQQNEKHETVAAEYKKLRDENDRLAHVHDQLLKENEVLQTDHKNLKTLLNNSKLGQTQLEAEFSKLREEYQLLDIKCTKISNQCELLSQLKGNMEEENRHLLDQIQTLMLQNRTLLEQNMESKDLFHVEQRQYIDKLNELRRQKEKLEEKIMDQYKFYEPSPPRRRGNWITLKMRKLMKSKKDVNRERQKSATLTPTRSESSEGFLQLPHQDSQDSSSVGSNSLEDGQVLGTKKSTMVALKRLPFLRNRPKEKDKMKAFYRRSMSMNDLVQSMVLAGGQWTGSSEHLEGPDDISAGKRRKELGAMAFSTTAINFATVNSSTGFRSKQLLNNKDAMSFEDVSPQGISDDSGTGSRVHGVQDINCADALVPPVRGISTMCKVPCQICSSRPASLDSGRTSTSNSNNNASLHEVKAGVVNNQSRPQSHSSGEFSMLHEHDAWSSSGSSPIQYLKGHTRSSPVLQQRTPETLDRCGKLIKTDSPGSEVVTLQQFLEESNKSTSSEMKSGSEENLLDEVMRSLSESSELTGKEKLRKASSGCGIVRSSSVKNPIHFSDGRSVKPEQLVRPSLHKTEDAYFTSSPIKFTSGTQGKAKSMKEKMQTSVSQRQSRDCNPYATLPRASSVISTAEGTTRRTSIHDFLSKDIRQPVSSDPTTSTADRSVPATSSEYSAHQLSSHFFHCVAYRVDCVPQSSATNTVKPRNLGCNSDVPKTSRMERSNFCEKTFLSTNMFNDKVSLSSNENTGSFTVLQPFLSLNTELVSNISGLPPRSASKADQANLSKFVPVPKNQDQPFTSQNSANRDLWSALSSEFVPATCVTTREAESLLLVSEDNKTVWYEYGCV